MLDQRLRLGADPNTDEAGFRATTGDAWSWARLHQLYAVVGGQVRYSCLWNAGQQAQTWHPICSEAEAMKLGADNRAWGRAHRIQPFVHNGQRRYSVLWSAGQRGPVVKRQLRSAAGRREHGRDGGLGAPAADPAASR